MLKTSLSSFVIVVCYFLITIPISAQVNSKGPIIEWERNFGGGRSEILHSVYHTMQDGFVAVGETRTQSEGGKDIFLVVTSSRGQQQVARPIGRDRDDVGYGVTQSLDGGYIIVGMSNSPGEGYSGKNDGLVMKTDENGKTLWAKLYGSREDDEFRSVLRKKDGNFVVTGVKDGKFWLAEIYKDGSGLAWQTTYDRYDYSIGQDLTMSVDGSLLITGHVREGSLNKVLLVKCTSVGEILWERTFIQNELEEGKSIIEMLNGDIAISGIINSKRYRKDMGLLITDPNGKFKVSKPFGSRGDDGGLGLAENFIGQIYLGGFGIEDRGDRRSAGMLTRVNPNDGERIWRNDAFLGKKLNDQINDMIFTSNGNLVMAGFTNRLGKSDQAWLIKLAAEEIPTVAAPTRLREGLIRFEDEDNNRELTPDERGYLRVEILNEGSSTAYNVTANVQMVDSVPGINYYPIIKVGQLDPGETRVFTVPISSDKRIEVGQNLFNVSFTEANNALTPYIAYEITSGTEPEPKLIISNPKFTAIDGGVPDRGKWIKLEVDLLNEGNKKAEGVRFKFGYPYKVTAGTDENLKVGTIPPKSKKTVTFEFKPENIYLEDTVRIICRAQESTSQFGDAITYELILGEIPIAVKPPTPDQQTRISWPRGFLGNVLESPNQQFEIGFTISSREPLNSSQVVIYKNGKPEPLSGILKEVPSARSDVFSYTFTSDNLMLDEGINAIEVEINGERQSGAIQVKYDPVRPNLIVLSVGTRLKNAGASFFSKDAADFSAIFQTLGGRYFDQVFVRTLTSRDSTVTQNLSRVFLDLRKMYDQGKIKKEDVLLVFIASQATAKVEGSFKIKASDYDGFFDDITSLDYEEILYRFLAPIDCNKFIFIDAFFAENPDPENLEDLTAPSKNLVQILNGPKSLPVLMSCSSGQLSYKDNAWQNGSFTKAIKEALSYSTVQSLDLNKNNIISITELYNYLKMNVPNISSNRNPAPLTPQVPYTPGNHLQNDFGIFETLRN